MLLSVSLMRCLEAAENFGVVGFLSGGVASLPRFSSRDAARIHFSGLLSAVFGFGAGLSVFPCDQSFRSVAMFAKLTDSMQET